MNRQYSEELKKQAVFNVLSGAMRKSEALREYGISSPTSLDRWMERYGHGILTEHKELLIQMGRRKMATSAKPGCAPRAKASSDRRPASRTTAASSGKIRSP